ncbi:DUF2913 family protein [Salmonella enterica subsp. enterica]
MTNYDNSCDLEHLTWCVQIAVGIAESDGKIGSDFSRHIFIMNWLRSAQKRRTFPKSVANEIGYLIREGLHGPGSRLISKIEFMYRSCGDLTRQSCLFRLTTATERLKDQDWTILLQSEQEWNLKKMTGSRVLAINKSRLNNSFSEEGEQIAPLVLRLWGDDTESALLVLAECTLPVRAISSAQHLLELELELELAESSSFTDFSMGACR